VITGEPELIDDITSQDGRESENTASFVRGQTAKVMLDDPQVLTACPVSRVGSQRQFHVRHLKRSNTSPDTNDRHGCGSQSAKGNGEKTDIPIQQRRSRCSRIGE
jgi:hypothetical protein